MNQPTAMINPTLADLAKALLPDSRPMEDWERKDTDEFFWSQFSNPDEHTISSGRRNHPRIGMLAAVFTAAFLALAAFAADDCDPCVVVLSWQHPEPGNTNLVFNIRGTLNLKMIQARCPDWKKLPIVCTTRQTSVSLWDVSPCSYQTITVSNRLTGIERPDARCIPVARSFLRLP